MLDCTFLSPFPFFSLFLSPFIVHCCCIDRLFSYSVPIFIFKLILTIYTVYRAQSFRIRVAKDGFDNFKQTFYNVSTQTHFCHVPLKMVSKYYQIIFNVLRLFFSHDINGYHINATTPILPSFAR